MIDLLQIDSHDSPLVAFARRELDSIGAFDCDAPYSGDVAKHVLDLVRVFAAHDHSVGSAQLTRDLFARLAAYQPLAPLTGESDEWMEVGPGVFQNRRCARVFKQNGIATDLDGEILRDPAGHTCSRRTTITFPYTPTSVYVDVASLPGEQP